jgi:hypothetical protein
MKPLKILLGLAVASAIASCSTNEDPVQRNVSNQVIGTYEGTLTSSIAQTVVPATAEVTSAGAYTVRMHCFSADLDTTLVLDLYQEGNMMRVCLTGDDFEKEYGHNMSNDHPMMGDNWTWQQHMSHDHNPSDNHYGHFDMNARTFDYTFEFKVMPLSRSRHFSGKR